MAMSEVDYLNRFKEHGVKTLWENPNPAAAWSGANITLADDITNYDGIVIYTRMTSSSTTDDCMGTELPPIIQPAGYYWMVGYCMYRDGYGWVAVARRATRFIDNTTLWISDSQDTDNSFSIPIKIIGIKQ